MTQIILTKMVAAVIVADVTVMAVVLGMDKEGR
jgi:hypothetical protein